MGIKKDDNDLPTSNDSNNNNNNNNSSSSNENNNTLTIWIVLWCDITSADGKGKDDNESSTTNKGESMMTQSRLKQEKKGCK